MSEFQRKHIRQIEQLSDLLLTRAEHFMTHLARHLLPAERFAQVYRPLSEGDLSGFAAALRATAVEFVMADSSSEFWSLLNALSSLHNALAPETHEVQAQALLDGLLRQLQAQPTPA